MSIEFTCPQCAKLLRTPDESAGKKAKCPQCSSIVDVPAQSSSLPSAEPISDQPFAPERHEPLDPNNPYAAPYTEQPAAGTAVLKGELQTREITFDDVINTTWKLGRAHLGELALLGIILVGAQIAMQMFSYGFQIAAELSQSAPLAVVAVTVPMFVNFAIQAYLALGTIIYLIKLARTGHAEVTDIFTAGPYFWRGLGVNLLLGLIFVGGMAALIGPAGIVAALNPPQEVAVAALALGVVLFVVAAVFVSLRLILSLYFVVDRGTGVVESMSASSRTMKGNMLATIFVTIVVGFLAMLFALFTCGCGYVVSAPFVSLAITVIFLRATGQPIVAVD